MEIHKIKIVLIEDDASDVELLRRMLEKSGGARFDLEVAGSLADGVARLRQGQIDVVLADLDLPDSARPDTFAALKAATSDLPIIVLSGLDDETAAVNAVHAGAEDYLVKDRVTPPLILRAILYAIERTQARTATQLAQEKYRSIFENSISGIFQTSPEGRYLNVNPALARIYGYSSAEELMSRISDIARLLYVDPHRRAEFIRLMQEAGVVKNFESQIYRKDGTVIWISENARAVRNREGGIEYYEGMVDDITARKEAEEKLRFSETRFRSVWQSATDGMRLTDEQGVILAVNRSFCAIIGMTSEELVGRNFTVCYSEQEDLAEMARVYQQRFADRTTDLQLDLQVTFRSGRAVDLEISNTFIDLEEGRSLLLGVFRDISKRKAAEERERRVNAELARSQAELSKKNEIMEQDLKMAREIQLAMLPQRYPSFPLGAPASESLLQFRHRYHPTSQVGGDFFNILRLSNNKAGLFICDVMGHGVRSALVTAMVRALVEELHPIAMDPGQLLTRINSDIRAILQQTGTPLFTTAFYMVADLESRQALYANAGHPKPFLIHRNAGQVEILKYADGKARPALGFFEDTAYPTATCPLRGGDMVMLFTDGLYEVEGPGGQQFSQELLLASVQEHARLHCEELFNLLLKEISAFSANHQFADDVCLLGMEVAERF
ncbi:MAG: PAS domain S-box protein [Verrucomicrobiota bacterium]|jgi:sigma-B regulation protein RsbU (phosphoserine phosphatase)